ncbi:hypothetical protein FHW21_001712 [Paraburkholderia sp. WP4_3_2]|nr:hypothetical protein [Paraburkholderia sp. WP4_3_2]
MNAGSKLCSKCKKVHAVAADAFSRNKNTKDGLAAHCKSCASAAYKDFYNRNRDKLVRRASEQVLARRRRDPEYDRKLSRDAKRRELSDPIRYARHLERYREWSKANPGKTAELRARRREEVARATPRWADLFEIHAKYKESNRLTKETGILHHVDHIIPIRGKLVCGLHVPHNLRVIPATENLRKSNRLIPELLMGLDIQAEPPSGGFSFQEGIQCPVILLPVLRRSLSTA